MFWLISLILLVLSIIFFWIVGPILLLLECLICLASLAAIYQERKIWVHPKVPSLTTIGMVRVFAINVVWMTVAILGSVVIAIEAAATKNWLNLKHTRKLAHNYVERKCAMLITSMIGPVVVKGTENLPVDESSSPAPIYVANHSSQIDAAVVYAIERQWRWIMKSSIKFLPGVGQLTYLGDHVWIDRSSKKNRNKDSSTGARHLYEKSDESIREGVPMFLFPQGTRSMGECLPFKDGAFKIALNNDTVLIPISIDIPLTAWNSLHPFGKADSIVLTVHKPIETKGKDIDTLKKETFESIYSVLPDRSKQD